MSKTARQGIVVVVITVCAVLAYWTIRFALQNEESHLRKLINFAAVIVEEKDSVKCASLIAPNYQDRFANNKEAIMASIKKIFRDFRNFKITIKNIKIKIDGLKATADIGFIVYFKVQEEEQIYYDAAKMIVVFEKQNGSWKVVSLDYTGSNELLFMNAVA
ncbi:MAG: nuclear transport factor 2 family protein [Candidatus Omnitrophota bacterium]